jgi:spore coat protein JA
MSNEVKFYHPYISPNDPCPPQGVKAYNTAINLYVTFQPPGLPQFSPYEALKFGTLWPSLYSPYESKMLEGRTH